jgi:transcription antitermination factor NusG
MGDNNSIKNKVWHVVYTRSRAEKKVYADLTAKGIECFLPVQKQLRQWKDRKKWVVVPLMPGYCFVHVDRRDYDRVLHTNNVVSYIIFNGKAAIVPDSQIATTERLLRQSDFVVEVSFENYKPGREVEIIHPPFTGLKGELIEAHGKQRFLLRLDNINTSFLVDIPAESLTFLSPGK